jgi:hypothetical protein
VQGKARRGRQDAPIAQRSEHCVDRAGREVAAHGVLDLELLLLLVEAAPEDVKIDGVDD